MDISGVTSSSGLHAVSGASTGAPPQQKMSNLFDSIDTSGSGSITQSQFEQAFQTKTPCRRGQGAAPETSAIGSSSQSGPGLMERRSALTDAHSAPRAREDDERC